MMVGEYLRAATRGIHEWGRHDCCLWPADWVLHKRGFDPAAQWRGRYDSQDAALAFVAQAGGMVAMWDGVLGQLERTNDPADGDVGVIIVHGPDGPVANGGIFADRRWSFLAPAGLFRAAIDPQFVLAAWHV